MPEHHRAKDKCHRKRAGGGGLRQHLQLCGHLAHVDKFIRQLTCIWPCNGGEGQDIAYVAHVAFTCTYHLHVAASACQWCGVAVNFAS